jgi:hypothetical protein
MAHWSGRGHGAPLRRPYSAGEIPCLMAQWLLSWVQKSAQCLDAGLHSRFICKTGNWRHPKCPSVGERVKNKLWNIDKMEHYAATKSNVPLTHEGLRQLYGVGEARPRESPAVRFHSHEALITGRTSYGGGRQSHIRLGWGETGSMAPWGPCIRTLGSTL